MDQTCDNCPLATNNNFGNCDNSPSIILYHESFLFMGNLESITMILLIKERADVS